MEQKTSLGAQMHSAAVANTFNNNIPQAQPSKIQSLDKHVYLANAITEFSSVLKRLETLETRITNTPEATDAAVERDAPDGLPPSLLTVLDQYPDRASAILHAMHDQLSKIEKALFEV